jgi:hypothetical protein
MTFNPIALPRAVVWTLLCLLVATGSSTPAKQTNPGGAPNAQFVSPDSEHLQYFGRIGTADPKAPTLHYGSTGLRTRFTGTSLALSFEEDDYGYATEIGIHLDKSPEIRLRLVPSAKKTYVVAVGLPEGAHDLFVTRRSDPLGGMCTFRGLWLDRGAKALAPPKRSSRRIEFFGDSIMAGGAAEAFGFEGRRDEEVVWDGDNGGLTNGYWSFGSITARLLKAEANVNGIGGLALLDKTGWWGVPLENAIGLETTYNKLNPVHGRQTEWDFSRFRPHVVVISIGQNDGHGLDVYDREQRARWKAGYFRVLDALRGHYPQARFVLTTTVMIHDRTWDVALKEVQADYSASRKTSRVHHYAFRRAGTGTPGHPRKAEHEEMGRELAAFIASLPDVWRDAP